MNNRGLSLWLVAVTIFISFVFLAVIAFSYTFRYTVIGVGLIVAVLVYMIKTASNGKIGKNRTVLFLFLIAIGALLLVFPNVQQTFTPLSISNVQVTDQGNRILIYARSGGGSAIEVDLTPQNLNSFLVSQGYQATSTSILTAEYIESSLNFPFSTQETLNNAVYLVSDTPVDLPGRHLSATVQDCIDAGIPNAVAIQIISVLRYKCIVNRINGYVNAFNTNSGSGGYRVRFALDGETVDLTNQNNFITMANGSVRIGFEGSLLTMNNLGAPQDRVFHVGNTWYLIEPEAYGNVRDGYTRFRSCVGDRPISDSQLASCKQQYYNTVNSNIDPFAENRRYIEQNAVAIESISFESGLLKVNLREPTFLPTYTIEMDASRVGIIRLSGTPNIVQCTEDYTFNEAGSIRRDVVVRNTASQAGSFNFEFVCTTPEFGASVSPADFAANEQKTISFLLNGGNSGTTTNTGSCTLTVTDRNSQRSDSCSFDVAVEYRSGIQQCAGNENYCSPDGKSVISCAGGNFVTTPCLEQCGLAGGISQCVSSAGGAGSGSAPPVDSRAICEQKAKDSPLLGYTYKESTTTSCGANVLCYAKIVKPKTIVTGSCTAAFIPYYTMVLIFAIVAVIVLGMYGAFKKSKRRRKRRR